MPMGGSSEDHQVSASSHNHWATQKAQCADKDKNAYPYSGPATSREPITQQQGAQVPHDLEGEGYLKQQKGNLYKIRICVLMLLCWHDYNHSHEQP